LREDGRRERLEADNEVTLKQWRQAAERAAYEAKRAERRYRAVDPDNRLVARGLEREWEQRLADQKGANEDLAGCSSKGPAFSPRGAGTPPRRWS